MFSKDATDYDHVSYSVAEQAKHLICDLQAGVYTVTLDGAPISGSPFTTDNGAITFRAMGGEIEVRSQ